MPTKPNISPNTTIENSTQNPEIPVLLPTILGVKILPSTCCKIIIKIVKYNALIGLVSIINITPGAHPINGPKKGIILVTATIKLIRSAYGILNTVIPI